MDSAQSPPPEVKLGGIPVQSVSDISARLSLFLWGASGVGKTSLAATAPGEKLIINFDPDGFLSVRGRSDVKVLDISKHERDVLEKLRTDNPMGLDGYLKEHPEIETVIIDSVTSLAELSLQHGIERSGMPSVSMENPGKAGYGRRNRIMLDILSKLIRVINKHNRHMILIGHEGDPTTDEKTNTILYVTILLGGQLVTQTGLRISEIWYMSEADKQRKLLIRPGRMRRPMKTRMFQTKGDTEIEFKLKYDQNKPDEENEHTIAKWWSKYQQAKGKIEVPK